MKKEYVPIIVGGIAGGIFWYVAQLVAGSANLVFGFEAIIYALFGGVIAAFINVYTLSDLDTTDPKSSGKVIANALIAAVAFPSIISSAVAVREASDAVDAKQQEQDTIESAQGEVQDVSTSLDSEKDLDGAALNEIESTVDDLKKKSTDPTLSVKAAQRIDADLKQLLDPLKERAETRPDEAERITRIIGTIGKDNASTTSKEATDKLVELRTNADVRVQDAATKQLKDVTEDHVSADAIRAVAPTIGAAPVPPPVVVKPSGG